MDHRYSPHISPSLTIPLWPRPQLQYFSSLWGENCPVLHTQYSPRTRHMYSIFIMIWPSILIDKIVSGVWCTIGFMPKRCCSIVNLKSLIFPSDPWSTYKSCCWWGGGHSSLVSHCLCTIKHLVAVWWSESLFLWEVTASLPSLGWNKLAQVHPPLQIFAAVWGTIGPGFKTHRDCPPLSHRLKIK